MAWAWVEVKVWAWVVDAVAGNRIGQTQLTYVSWVYNGLVKWKVLNSEVKYQNKYMTVTEDGLITDHGQNVTFGIVRKEPAVIIIPWDGEKFIMVRQYRYAVDFESWEFPAGHYEHSSIKETANTELREEAGLKAGELQELGVYHIAPGHMTQVCHIFLATNLTHVPRELEQSEQGMTVGEFSPGQVDQMIKEGIIKDGLTIVAKKFFDLMVP